MIVRELDGDWVVIEQAEHARHAGELAQAWSRGPLGNGLIAPGLVVATRLHDIGWTEPDAEPRLDPETGGPQHFTRVHDRLHAGFYTAGILQVAAVDDYAGYLVSLHATGIYAGRFAWSGLEPIAWESLGERGWRFLDEQAVFRRRLAARIAVSDPDAIEFERVWHDYMLLQTFDYLSLLVCAGVESNRCGPVPTGGHTWGHLRVERTSPCSVELDPFPFTGDRIDLTVSCRRLAAVRFRSDAELRDALSATPGTELVTTFVRSRR
ncbi:MAG TPA: DUF3891 family protein [Candidatus Dormibacteraeota bacterium]|nr:DUF3891 family protein [Candidatus Dormibacteraeota bacterium]